MYLIEKKAGEGEAKAGNTTRTGGDGWGVIKGMRNSRFETALITMTSIPISAAPLISLDGQGATLI